MNHRVEQGLPDSVAPFDSLAGQVTYLYDPLCGWCYGAMPALEVLQSRAKITFVPTGLFAGEGARVMDANFAAYAWENDQRIASLTGQPFSERYREQVLLPGTAFDSTVATLALVAVSLDAPDQLFAACKAIQHARYVDGRDTSVRQEVAAVLDGMGLSGAAARLLANDRGVLAAARHAVATGRRLMAAHGARGVPTVVLSTEQGDRLIPSQLLYGEREALLRQLDSQ
ncbi:MULTISPECIES: DsbA family protein [unclassified Chelatococcus]|uniref:DsbA family protein n=1 Tax=unclassified Chelatococcus TaxID=2638111 RepID=UPI001BCFEEE7|nr:MULTISPECIES: DsbA family protein [unclassified Chelatococcus]MBS7699787.1 DsbA family protein [Chelatococcus sp. YT9]MBX3558133.1 DsbA family protein [Chelatococcus sp.]